MNRIVVAAILMVLCSIAWGQSDEDMAYVNITPSFITNYDEGARLKYLKADVSIKIVAEAEEMIRFHMPSIQNGLVIFFSSKAEEDLTSTVGRETLRREALDVVKRVMSTLERSGDLKVSDLYFNNFVVQS